jgi:hypothetical protein
VTRRPGFLVGEGSVCDRETSELPDSLELAPGEERAFKLRGLASAGYVWNCEIVGDGDVVDTHWTSETPPSPRPRPGWSAAKTLTLRGLRPGVVELRLYCHRPWEPPDSVLADHRLAVHVKHA